MSKACDVRRSHDFAGLTAVALRGAWTRRDVFAVRRFVERPGDLLALKLQIVETPADHLEISTNSRHGALLPAAEHRYEDYEDDEPHDEHAAGVQRLKKASFPRDSRDGWCRELVRTTAIRTGGGGVRKLLPAVRTANERHYFPAVPSARALMLLSSVLSKCPSDEHSISCGSLGVPPCV